MPKMHLRGRIFGVRREDDPCVLVFLRGIKLGLIKPKVGPGIQKIQVIPEGSMEPGIPSEVLTN